MPGSPVEVKIQSRSSPPNMPPLPPVNPGGPRPVSFTPTARKTPVLPVLGAALAHLAPCLCLSWEQLWPAGKALPIELPGMSQPFSQGTEGDAACLGGRGDRGFPAVL